MRRVWMRPAIVVVLTGVSLTGLTAVELGAHPVRGARYTGSSGGVRRQHKAAVRVRVPGQQRRADATVRERRQSDL